jgi:hypothetical protein
LTVNLTEFLRYCTFCTRQSWFLLSYLCRQETTSLIRIEKIWLEEKKMIQGQSIFFIYGRENIKSYVMYISTNQLRLVRRKSDGKQKILFAFVIQGCSSSASIATNNYIPFSSCIYILGKEKKKENAIIFRFYFYIYSINLIWRSSFLYNIFIWNNR